MSGTSETPAIPAEVGDEGEIERRTRAETHAGGELAGAVHGFLSTGSAVVCSGTRVGRSRSVRSDGGEG